VMMSVYVYYDCSDFDGKCCGAIAKRRYRGAGLFPMMTRGKVRIREEHCSGLARGDLVVFMDGLPVEEDLVRVAAQGPTVVVIDHHRTNMERYAKAREATDCVKERVLMVYREDWAACEIAWCWMFPDKIMPDGVRLLGRYDVWDHEDPIVLEFQYGARSVRDTSDLSSDFWKDLISGRMSFVNRIAEGGRFVKDYVDETNARYVRAFAFETEAFGMPAVAVNLGHCNSLVFDDLPERGRFKLMITFVRRQDGFAYTVFSDDPDVDCGELCAKVGGGGHKGAAGFQDEKMVLPVGRRAWKEVPDGEETG